MLVARAHQARALDDRRRAYAGRVAQRDRAVARRLRTRHRADGSTPRSCPLWATTLRCEGASPEATVLEAVAGLRAPVEHDAAPSHGDLGGPPVPRRRRRAGDWRASPKPAGCRRATRSTPRWPCAAIGATLAASDSLATARDATAALNQLRPALEPIEPSERTTAPPPPDLASLAEQAARDLARVRATRGPQTPGGDRQRASAGPRTPRWLTCSRRCSTPSGSATRRARPFSRATSRAATTTACG